MSVSVTTLYIGPQSLRTHARAPCCTLFRVGRRHERASSIAPHEQHSAAGRFSGVAAGHVLKHAALEDPGPGKAPTALRRCESCSRGTPPVFAAQPRFQPGVVAAKKAAALKIQAAARGHRARALRLKRQRQIVMLQARARGIIYRQARSDEAREAFALQAVTHLQAAFRAKRARTETAG